MAVEVSHDEDSVEPEPPGPQRASTESRRLSASRIRGRRLAVVFRRQVPLLGAEPPARAAIGATGHRRSTRLVASRVANAVISAGSGRKKSSEPGQFRPGYRRAHRFGHLRTGTGSSRANPARPCQAAIDFRARHRALDNALSRKAKLRNLEWKYGSTASLPRRKVLAHR